MTTKTEALKLALEAYIKAGYGNSTDFHLQNVAYAQALQALAQPEQEPVAHIGMIDEEHFADVCRKAGGNSNTPLFTSPRTFDDYGNKIA